MNIVNTVTAYDLSALPFIENRWYRVGSSISTYQFYLDTTDVQGNHLRSPMQVTILATDNLRQFATEDGYYYVASLNVIYLRSASEWTRITDTYADKPAATLYDDDGARTDIVDVIDNNGLLKNGSVVIRDSNRVVKAIMSVDNNGDIQIKPYLGGGLRLCDNQSGSMLLKNGQVTYDKIIAPGGGDTPTPPSYTLPIATPTTLGGVMPVGKSSDMTQTVGVDDAGRLYTAPGSGASDLSLGINSATVGQIAKITAVDENGKPTAWTSVNMPGGGVEKEWVKIIDTEVMEATSSFVVSSLTEVTEFYIRWSALKNASTTDSGLNVSINDIIIGSFGAGALVSKSSSNLYGWTRIIYNGLFWSIFRPAEAATAQNLTANSNTMTTYCQVENVGAATKIELAASPVAQYAPVSGKLEVWAR